MTLPEPWAIADADARRLTRAEATHRRVGLAALSLFVERGINETSTRDIAEHAGIAEATLFRHFMGKDELGCALFARHHSAIARTILDAADSAEGIANKARAITRAYCRLADEDWLAFRFHLIGQRYYLGRMPRGLENPVDAIGMLIERAMDRGEIPRRDIGLVTAMALGIVHQAASHRLWGRIKTTLSENADTLAEAVVGVIFAGAAPPEDAGDA